MGLRTSRRERSLGATLLLWGLALLGVLFVLSVVVATVISIVTTVVAIVTTAATALLLGGIAYLVASWALGSARGGRGDRGHDRRGHDERGHDRRGHDERGHETARRPSAEYGVDAAAQRRSADGRPDPERSDTSLLGLLPGIGSGSDDSGEATPTEDPIDRLADQYVRGEIGEAEYERRLERHLGRSETSRDRLDESPLEREYDR